jgi:hypothetical protein
MNSITFSPDKFGYYIARQNNGSICKTYSVAEAYEFSNSVKWHFNDEVFSKYNWKIEPIESLFELYKKRCQQIRENYDYIVLMYSAGADSDNILNCFVRNNIKLDEVFSWNNISSLPEENFQNLEFKKSITPALKKLKDNNGKIIEHVNATDKSYLDEKYLNIKDLFYYDMGMISNPLASSRTLFREDVKHWKNLINSGKSVCILWGHDKPQILLDSNMKLYTKFTANNLCVTASVQNRYNQGWYDEYFYWSPDLPELIIKQCHLLKNHIKKHNFNVNELKNNFSLYDEMMKRIIYPFWLNSVIDIKREDRYIYREHMPVENAHTGIEKVSLDHRKLWIDAYKKFQDTTRLLNVTKNKQGKTVILSAGALTSKRYYLE